MDFKVTVHQCADREMRAFKRDHPKAFAAMIYTVSLLAKEANPMNPRHPDLQVCALRWQGQGWFRFRIIGHAQWRVVFRLLQAHGNSVWEVCMKYELDSSTKQVIQITAVGHRDSVYSKLTALHDKVAGLV